MAEDYSKDLEKLYSQLAELIENYKKIIELPPEILENLPQELKNEGYVIQLQIDALSEAMSRAAQLTGIDEKQLEGAAKKPSPNLSSRESRYVEKVSKLCDEVDEIHVPIKNTKPKKKAKPPKSTKWRPL